MQVGAGAVTDVRIPRPPLYVPTGQLNEHRANTCTVLVLGSSGLWTLSLLLLLRSSESPSHIRLGNVPSAWAVGFNGVELSCDSCLVVCCYLTVETCVRANLGTGSHRALHQYPGDLFPVPYWAEFVCKKVCARDFPEGGGSICFSPAST